MVINSGNRGRSSDDSIIQSYHETYLKEWAVFIMKELFTTAPEEVERQIADMKVVSSNTEQLDKFFKEHLDFVKGSNISSVFLPKKSKSH
ncbi:MAG: hypothetical protein AB8W32_13410 [Arsenophonus endosymbiont of Dermacentor nuttalli]